MKRPDLAQMTLAIADLIIEMRSQFPVEPLTKTMDWRFRNFLYRGRRQPDVRIVVNVVDELPAIPSGRDLFVTTHFQDHQENWRWQQADGHFVYRTPLTEKRQCAIVNQALNEATLWVLSKEGRHTWKLGDVIYDFLQILLINYLAQRDGAFAHGIGLKDTSGKGLLFVGKSGAGKSTTARLWHQHSRATILNDDRIIIRKRGQRFYIHGTPWHGDFSDYLASTIDPAPLERLFFIYHARQHISAPMATAQAFCELYSCLFPTFWDRRGLERTAALCQELIGSVPVARLGFRKDRSVIAFVRQRCR